MKRYLQQDMHLQKMKNNLRDSICFFGQFLRSPAQTGSIWPSSPFLVQQLVHMATCDNAATGLIVDLGAGSGVVSQELLTHGISPAHILAIDISRHCGAIFRKNCPDLRLHIGDARNLADIVSRHYPGQQIRAIISSLPLRSLPARIVREIMYALWRLLRMGGMLIQFTYALWQHSSLEQYGFTNVERHYVPLNMPPALVEKYSARQ